MPERWNANLHAFGLLLDRLPPGLQRGLDVGCGEGETARRLRVRVAEVVGIDTDEPSIEAARAAGGDVEYQVADLLDSGLPEASFDVVTAVAVLHHLDHRAGLEQLRRLLRPGGLLLVVGFARSRSVGDLARDAVDSIAIRRHTFTRPVWHTPAPKLWPPSISYGEARTVALDVLPGARFERLPYLRYGLTWTRPDDDNP